MRAHHRSRAFAVQVEVADVELAHGTIEFLARTGVDGAGQPKLGVVGDLQRMIEVAGADTASTGRRFFCSSVDFGAMSAITVAE